MDLQGWGRAAAQEGNGPVPGMQWTGAGCSCPLWHFNATAFHFKAEQLRF